MSALETMIQGGQGFASTERMLAGLSREVAVKRIDPLPYTIYGLLWHIECCQAILLRQLAGEAVQWPSSAEQWPHLEPDETAWEAALLERLRMGLEGAATLAAEPSQRSEAERELLEDLCAHNAYHWGQVVTLRRLLGDWDQSIN